MLCDHDGWQILNGSHVITSIKYHCTSLNHCMMAAERQHTTNPMRHLSCMMLYIPNLNAPSFMHHTPGHPCTVLHAPTLMLQDLLYTQCSPCLVCLQGMGTASTGQCWLLWWKASALTPGLLALQPCQKPSSPSNQMWSPAPPLIIIPRR